METPTLPSPSTNGHASLPASRLSEISDLISTSKSKPQSPSGPLSLRSGERAGDRGLHLSRTHAIKHGMDATDDVFVESLGEHDTAAYHKLRRSLYRFYTPNTSFERLLVNRMAVQHLRMLCLYRLEITAMRFLPINKGSDRSIFPHLDRFSRYDNRIERQLRILHNRYILVREQNTGNYFKSFPSNE